MTANGSTAAFAAGDYDGVDSWVRLVHFNYSDCLLQRIFFEWSRRRRADVDFATSSGGEEQMLTLLLLSTGFPEEIGLRAVFMYGFAGHNHFVQPVGGDVSLSDAAAIDGARMGLQA